MATYHGKDGIVSCGGTTVAELQSWDLDVTSENVKTTSIGDSTHTRAAGLKDWSGSLSLNWDGGDAAQNGLAAGELIEFIFYPQGEAGGETFTGEGIIASHAVPNPLEGLVTLNVSFSANGGITRA